MTVSLYVPCFNSAAHIEKVLKGIFNQSLSVDEVVVVDDCSGDETLEIASRYPVRIIKHPKNKGLAAARNTAVSSIDSEFIASLDSDCVPDRNWLETLIGRMGNLEIAGAGGKLIDNYDPVNVCDFWRSVHMKQHWEDSESYPDFLYGSNTIFRRKALIDIGGYREELKNNYEDVDICFRLKKAGYVFIYEPKAAVRHLKMDDVRTLLNNYWNWNLGYYQKEGYYNCQKNFLFKLRDNIGLANRYLQEDITSKRSELIYLDFLLALHHSLKDFQYFICRENNNDYMPYLKVSFWLSLLDLTFFYHFESEGNKRSTFIPAMNLFIQNFLALNLIVGGVIRERFKNNDFKRRLYKHLFLSLYGFYDEFFLDKLTNLIDVHPDWSRFYKNKFSNLDPLFLEKMSVEFNEWLDGMIYRFNDIRYMIEISSKKVEESTIRRRICYDN